MNLNLGLDIGSERAVAGTPVGPSPTYVWLGESLTAAPALSGVPVNSTYLNRTETSYVTRNGVKMLSIASGTTATNSGGFASVPWWLQTNVFNAAQFELAAGTWQVGIIGNGNLTGNTLKIIDNPLGTPVERQSIALTGALNSLSDTDGTTYTNAGTAIAGVVAGMTLVPVIVTNTGGGVGTIRVYAEGPGTATISAIALLTP